MATMKEDVELEANDSAAEESPKLEGEPKLHARDSVLEEKPQQSIAMNAKKSVFEERQQESNAMNAIANESEMQPIKLKPALKPQEHTQKKLNNKGMIGAHVELSTGNTLPYNMWGPSNPTRFGVVGEMPPNRDQKYNYEGKQETIMKDRLEERDFGHVRHHCYRKNLVEPTGENSLAWMDPKRKEFWRTDVERVLKKDEEERRARQKELLGIMTNKEAWRRHNAQKMRDMKYQAYLDLSENMQKVGCRNNLSGAPHINIITREPIGEHNIKAVKFRDDCNAYKKVQRTLMLQDRNSGARDYNILNWTKNPAGPELSPWPEKPPTPPPPPLPDTRTPLNSSKGAISCGRVYGAFGNFNIP